MDRYHKAATVLRDYFHYVDTTTFDGTNGKVQGRKIKLRRLGLLGANV